MFISQTQILFVLYFFTYCFIGWCIESSIVSIEMRKFVNRGFLRAPLLPLYGCAAMIIVICTDSLKENPTLVFVVGFVMTTLLEYATGCLLEAVFGRSYWDYNDYKFNFQGRISLTSSLFWGFLSILLVYTVHPALSVCIALIPPSLAAWLAALISLVFVLDAAFSIKAAFDITKISAAYAHISKEISYLAENITDEAREIARERLEALNGTRRELLQNIDEFKRAHFRGNPDMKTKLPIDSDTFHDLKEKILSRISK
ncbi:MAG: putative ABC transporter permease [Clostridia bacterium]|nr:putative ABC transporter permease [Clostridia bacterium]